MIKAIYAVVVVSVGRKKYLGTSLHSCLFKEPQHELFAGLGSLQFGQNADGEESGYIVANRILGRVEECSGYSSNRLRPAANSRQ